MTTSTTLTTAQTATVKAFIIADATLGPKTSGPGTDYGFIADSMSSLAAPAFIVWKSNVSIGAIGDNFVGTELAGLTSANQARLQTIAQFSLNGIDPSLADRRAFFDDIFSGAGGTATRAKLLALWKRSATRVEKVLATGTGSDAAPATMVYEGGISINTIADMFRV
jgi:hypothetical protein